MNSGHNRRRFLQSSLAAGAVLGLAGASPQPAGGPTPVSGTTGGGSFSNPQVSPGRVQWRGSFDAACAAARRSSKPVFLFHMMGRLDQRFC
jgi:hypothetical protein